MNRVSAIGMIAAGASLFVVWSCKQAPTAAIAPPPLKTLDPGQMSPDILDRCKRAAVLIVNLENDQITGTGSGFVTGEGLSVVTNKHVVVGTDYVVDPLRLVFFSGTDKSQFVSIEPEDIDLAPPEQGEKLEHERDLAVVRLKKKVVDPLPIGSAEEESETAYAWAFGFPRGLEVMRNFDNLPSPSVHAMRIERLERQDGKVRVLQVGGSATFGNSGGAVTNGNGEVVGVMQSKQGDSIILYAVPSQPLKEFLAMDRAQLVAAQKSRKKHPASYYLSKRFEADDLTEDFDYKLGLNADQIIAMGWETWSDYFDRIVPSYGFTRGVAHGVFLDCLREKTSEMQALLPSERRAKYEEIVKTLKKVSIAAGTIEWQLTGGGNGFDPESDTDGLAQGAHTIMLSFVRDRAKAGDLKLSELRPILKDALQELKAEAVRRATLPDAMLASQPKDPRKFMLGLVKDVENSCAEVMRVSSDQPEEVQAKVLLSIVQLLEESGLVEVAGC